MGDNGKMYVPKDLLPVYRDTILPLADIITPNQFELELLTGERINNANDAWLAIDSLHQKGCKTVVISSSDLGDDEYLLSLASSIGKGNKVTATNDRVTIKIPKLTATFTGTGDLFAALLLAWMHKTDNDLKWSLENTVSTLQAVLKRTLLQTGGTGWLIAAVQIALNRYK